MKKYTIKIVPQLLLWAFVLLVCQPRFAFGFAGIFVAVAASGLLGLWLHRVTQPKPNPYSGYGEPGAPVRRWSRAWLGVAGSALVAIVLGIASSLPVFRAEGYRGLVRVQTEDFVANFDLVDPKRARVVTETMAHRIASIKLGEDPGLSSRVHIGKLVEQKVGDLIYWVAPLEHSTFLKWWGNGHTPGYVMVCSSNEQDVRLVEKSSEGQPLNMRFLSESYWSQNAERLVYRAFPSVGADDFTFEVDDQGDPYIVATLYDHKVGWGGADPIGVVVVDVQTGAIARHDLDDVPSWVDRVVPDHMIQEQLDGWGEYVHGWLSSRTGNDIIHPSTEATLVYGADGQTYWYFDARGARSSNGSGAMGHFLVNSRTKATTLYRVAGSAHEVAQASIQGEVQQMRYGCGRVLPYMAHGEMVYMGPLTDQADLRKGIGIALYRDPSVVGTGDTVDEALRALKRHMAQRGRDLAPAGKIEVVSIGGRVRSAALDDGTLYLTLEGPTSDSVTRRGYAVPSDLNPEVRFTTAGDSVTIRFESSDEPVADVIEFDNARLDFSPKPVRATAQK